MSRWGFCVLAAALLFAGLAESVVAQVPGMTSRIPPALPMGSPPIAPGMGGPMLPGTPPPGFVGGPGSPSTQGVPTYPGPLSAMLGHRHAMYRTPKFPQPAGENFIDNASYEIIDPTFGDPHPRGELLPDGFLNGVSLTFDYLHYRVEKPNVPFAGAPQFELDPGDPFVSAQDSFIYQSVLTPFELNDMPGVRAALVMPLDHGDLELGVRAWGQADDSVTQEAQLTQGLLGGFFVNSTVLASPAIPLLSSGVPVDDTAILFDSLQLSVKSELMGANVDYALKPFGPENGLFRASPVLGFQYLRFRETFDASGVFEPTVVVDPVTGDVISDPAFSRRINARIDNHLIGPTLSMRFELGNDWFSLMAEPKLAIVANRRRERLVTSNLGSTASTVVPTPVAREDSDLAPYFELNVKANLRLTQRLSAHVGYNLLTLTKIGRPQDALVFDSISGAPVISIDDKQQTTVISGLFVGGEVLLGPMPQ